MANLTLDLDEDLLKDENLVQSIKNLDHSIVEIQNVLESRLSVDYSSLTVEEKIKHDLSITFALNGLYWMYLRCEGTDPTNHNVKSELDRIKAVMQTAKVALNKKNMPKLDKEATSRFVGHALWDSDNKKRRSQEAGLQNKRVKFDDNGDPTSC
ncbi:nuclear nucleic acid-binding protein C1D [Adelges cooleyi]|uniref:nuclear nucleic acid-binding protein C1D n=1 Tax=Adelges cooleyi TaxID=133065 RepID=UPI00217F4158|nr:nuclear nucleic acid-binding protein C1D [Adelges cooleyi]